MSVKLANNVETRLTTAITATNIVIHLQDGGAFPSLTAGEWFPLTLEDNQGNGEIVHVVGRTGNSLTVTRAQEGTTPRNFPALSLASLRLTAAVIDELAGQMGLMVNTIDTKLSEEQADIKYLPKNGGQATGDIIRSGSQFGFYKISIPDGAQDGGGVAMIPQTDGKSAEISYMANGGARIYIEDEGNVAKFNPNGDALFQGNIHAGGGTITGALSVTGAVTLTNGFCLCRTG